MQAVQVMQHVDYTSHAPSNCLLARKKRKQFSFSGGWDSGSISASATTTTATSAILPGTANIHTESQMQCDVYQVNTYKYRQPKGRTALRTERITTINPYIKI